MCCPISNTSKIDSVAGRANNSEVLVKKIVVCLFVLQVVHFLEILGKTLTKIPIKSFLVSSKNKQDLIKTFKSKREYVSFNIFCTGNDILKFAAFELFLLKKRYSHISQDS